MSQMFDVSSALHLAPSITPVPHGTNGFPTARFGTSFPRRVSRKSFSATAGLRWKLGMGWNPIAVRCVVGTAEKVSEEASGEKFEYQAEVSRLMDLIVHSLYSHKEVFLRELVSNASDALDKLRFVSITDPSLIGDASELAIRIKPDLDNGTITITDSGIGMTREELIDCLGTIAQSGTSKFLKALKENKDSGANNDLIGQFGVGFYSAFLVADKVVVSTKSPRSDKQYVWEAAADSSSYVIKEESDPEKLLPRGTQITLFLRPDEKFEFAEPKKIQELVKNYSQFVSFPIYTWQEKSRTVEVDNVDEETLKEGEEPKAENEKKKTVTEKYWDWELANETKPIWMRNPKEIEKNEYNEFYKMTFNEFLDPLRYTHFTTEGEVEFRSVLYIPGMAPLNNEDIVNDKKKNIRLYVKRVFISDDFDGELFPRYLSFVKGVVDSNDLSLNVSREILQESRMVRIMRKRLVRKTFDMIDEISKSEDKEDYKKFWDNFGKLIKLGCIEDSGNHKRLAPLLRFYSSKSGEEMIGLDSYIENMSENQKVIFYLATDSLKSAKSAPFMEKLTQKDIEVLYLVDPIDEVSIQNLQTYKEKKFVDISKEDLELGDEDEVKERENQQECNLLCDWMKQQLGEKVAKVQISKRLSSSPCVLVSGKFGWSANMERLMKAQTLGDTSSMEFMRGRRILEINPDHPIIKDLNAACKNDPSSSDAQRAVDLLYDTALISSGFTPDSPAELGGKIFEMMAIALGGRWGRSEVDSENKMFSKIQIITGLSSISTLDHYRQHRLRARKFSPGHISFSPLPITAHYQSDGLEIPSGPKHSRRDLLVFSSIAIAGSLVLSSAVSADENVEKAPESVKDTEKVKDEDASGSRIYDATTMGEPLAVGKGRDRVWEKLLGARVVYLGEAETVPDRNDRLLELDIVRNLRNKCFEQKRPISLALEVFPLNLQKQLNLFMSKKIDGEDLRSWVFHWPPPLWKDYEPLLNYCRDNGVRLIACGTPLEIVRTVQAEGIHGLSKAQRRLYAPPIGSDFISGISPLYVRSGIGMNSPHQSIPFAPSSYLSAQARVVDDYTMSQTILQATKDGGVSGMLVVVTGASHVIYGARGVGIPARISKKLHKKSQAVILLDPERQQTRREGDVPVADFLWYSSANTCSRNCFDRAEIAQVMNAAGRRREALPQDLQRGLDLGLVSPENLQDFFDLEKYPIIAELIHRFQVIAGLVEHRISDYILAYYNQPMLVNVLSFVVRTINSYWGTQQWVDLARFSGLQPQKILPASEQLSSNLDTTAMTSIPSQANSSEEVSKQSGDSPTS